MKITAIISTTILLLSCSYLVKGQGCSDAGFCTLNSFKPNTSDTIAEAGSQFKIGVSYGDADHSISALGTYLEYNKQITEKFGLDAKVTALSQTGNDISNFGISDIYLNGNYNPRNKIRLTIGAKIPLTNANEMKDNLPLPMDYQSSLGTFDLILGIGYEIKNFQLVVAFQQPLSQNKNEFLAENFPINSKVRGFQSTNKFKRSGDALLRVSYPIRLRKKIKITPSVLPIFHLSKDKYTDSLGIERDIAGSEGLTLNGNAYFDFEINKQNIIQLNLGIPFVVRDIRPDGLTRSFIANLEYRIKF